MPKRVDSEAIYYPVFLNVKGRRCAVIGGGEVALRKVITLLEDGAKVTVISPELCLELASLAKEKKIKYAAREYKSGDLKGVFVAIAATDNSIINRRVAAEARKQAALVNVVDDAGESDFIAPAIIRRGEITIAISTSGQSPALARKLRVKLENEFGEEYGRLGRLIGEARAQAKKLKITVDGEGWQAALDIEKLLSLIKKGEEKKAKETLLSNLKARQKKNK
ncbi:MAG TPA: bifunctional precorrin-2 dehydrogenase/sirohydrochlorin ferrochelatase [Dehalococcoidales bacterium]|nr:bifunctional precorrin-2 dehydrogenase/sirohydrochlorin ferrochelatase [Dehalococcoidales bacterium]